jgi:hypothetical protein
MHLPAKLYKYEALTARTLQNLKSQIIYFGSPLGFNDPYDCALNPSIQTPSDGDVEIVRQHYINRENLSPKRSGEIRAMSTESLRQMLVRATQTATDQQIADFLANKGVSCFSEINDDLLMWSHYGGRYQGICLEFSTLAEPFNKVRKVEYVDRPPSVGARSLLIDDSFDPVSTLFATKSKSWSYEREWRAFHRQAGTKFVYASSALTGVYFGPDVELEPMEIVCLILAGQNETVRLWKGQRSKTEFKVEFEQFSYTSHLQAKMQGLKPHAGPAD